MAKTHIMKRTIAAAAALLFGLFLQPVLASDACSTRAIVTAADVQVSDGSSFRTESFFQAADTTAIRHIDEDIQTIAVEGPVAWIARGNKAQSGGDQLRMFALGHQFHAMLLHFDEMATGIVEVSDITFDGGRYPGRGGKFIYGGEIYLVHETGAEYPLGFVLDLPDQPAMQISLSEWKVQDQVALPFHVRIDDSSRVFDYAYREVGITQESPTWFYKSVDALAVDELKIYRLHRRLLAAHCTRDADLIANLTALATIVANRGTLEQPSREMTRTRFDSYFKNVVYTQYHDLVPPLIEVAESGDIGWIAVNVRATGKFLAHNQSFDQQWAWIMLVEKIDGVWLNAGNASNVLPSVQE